MEDRNNRQMLGRVVRIGFLTGLIAFRATSSYIISESAATR
jgi:hypothetical protein